MFFCLNKTVCKILVLSIFNTWGKLFSSYFSRIFKLNKFTINFFPKEVGLVSFFSLEMTFSRNSADSAFSFWLYSPERKLGIHGNFKIFNKIKMFSSNLKVWYHTDLRELKWIPLRCFSTKQHSFQDSCINHLRCLGKSLFRHILESF